MRENLLSELLNPTDISYRKFQRKAKQDGLRSALIAAPEFLVRKKFGRPIFDLLLEYGLIRSISRSELPQASAEIHPVESDSQVNDSVPNSAFVAEIEGGYAFPKTGLAVTDHLEVLEESVSNPASARNFVLEAFSLHCFFGDRCVARPLLTSDQQSLRLASTEISVASPLAPRHPNYYHWMVETVPRIRNLKSYENRTGDDVTLLVPSDLPAWMDETLELLEWPASKIERATTPVYHVDKLILPSFPEFRSEDYQWISDTVLANAQPEPESANFGNNVYISRSNDVERRVLNEDAVVEMLSKYGFQRYNLEDLSLHQNAHLFNEADMIVGPHGAGLTDLIFCEDAIVLELFGSKTRGSYERLASLCDTKYEAVYCEPDSTDILVDVEMLEAIVAERLPGSHD